MDSFYLTRTCHPNPIKQQADIFLFVSAKNPNSYQYNCRKRNLSEQYYTIKGEY